MLLTFFVLILLVHKVVRWGVSINPIWTFILGMTLLTSIAVYIDRKEGRY